MPGDLTQVNRSERKIRAARVSIATASALAAAKLLIGFLTGSLAVIASAIDSLLDILMSGINYFAIRHAEVPADENHPFGHGKFETVATLVQACIIGGSGVFIMGEAVRRLQGDIPLQRLEQGMIVLLISIGASAWVSRYLRRVARATDSTALKADALHFSMDVYTNLALVVGLILINLFHAPWIDPGMSLLVGAYILFEAFKLVRQSMRDILDTELPQEIREEVEAIIDAHEEHIHDIHNLRTRGAGSQKIMDFHLTVCRHMSVAEAHHITDDLEETIGERIPGADVTIHIEPCVGDDCPGKESCAKLRKTRKPEEKNLAGKT